MCVIDKEFNDSIMKLCIEKVNGCIEKNNNLIEKITISKVLNLCFVDTEFKEALIESNQQLGFFINLLNTTMALQKEKVS